MSYRKTTSLSLAAALLGIGLSAVAGHAELINDTFTSQRHKVTFNRPDPSWELRDNPAMDNAIALFSNGEGRVIALLIHDAIPPSEVLTSAENLKSRWPQLSSRITEIATGGQSGVTIEFSEEKLEPSRAVFDIVFASRSPKGGEPMRSWVSGMIIRDNSGRQHIYAICCAAPKSSFGAWEGQFERIAKSLNYTGVAEVSVFTKSPAPMWWWLAGGFVLLAVLFVIRKSAAGSKHKAEIARMKSTATKPLSNEPEFGMGMGTYEGIPDNVLPPVPLPPTEDSEMNNVPDQFLMQQHAEPTPPSPEPLSPAPMGTPEKHDAHATTATEDEEKKDTPPQAAGFWKCRCGRMNPLDDGFCARCNLDRPRGS